MDGRDAPGARRSDRHESGEGTTDRGSDAPPPDRLWARFAATCSSSGAHARKKCVAFNSRAYWVGRNRETRGAESASPDTLVRWQRSQAATASLILIFPLELCARVFAPTARRAADIGGFVSAVGAG